MLYCVLWKKNICSDNEDVVWNNVLYACNRLQKLGVSGFPCPSGKSADPEFGLILGLILGLISTIKLR